MHLSRLKSQPPKILLAVLPSLEAIIFCRRKLINSNFDGEMSSQGTACGTGSRLRRLDGESGGEEMRLESINETVNETGGNETEKKYAQGAEIEGKAWVRLVDVVDRLMFYVFFTFCTLIVLGFPISGIIMQQHLVN